MYNPNEEKLKTKFRMHGMDLLIEELGLSSLLERRIREMLNSNNSTLEELLKIPKVEFMRKKFIGEEGCKELVTILSVLGLALKGSNFSANLDPNVRFEDISAVREDLLSKNMARYLTRKGYKAVGDVLECTCEDVFVAIGKERYEKVLELLEYDKYQILTPTQEELKKVKKTTPVKQLPITEDTKNYILKELGYKNLAELLKYSKDELLRKSICLIAAHNIAEIDRLVTAKNWEW